MSSLLSNSSFFYYLNGGLMEIQKRMGSRPGAGYWQKQAQKDQAELKRRLDYYMKFQGSFEPEQYWPTLAEIDLPGKLKTYYFDLLKSSRYFPKDLQLRVHFGDNTERFEQPTLVKTRPISEPNQGNILLRFNAIRHFHFVEDRIPYEKKKNILFGRGHLSRQKPDRLAFYEKHFDHPLCDLGQINKGTTHDQWYKPKVSIGYHLEHKFVLCLEGVDVASNLKWVMSSNSIALMPVPKRESWFMEGELVAGKHFIAVADDFSDVEQQIEYYLQHPEEANQIIKNAQEYVKRFQNPAREKLLGLLVLDRYFHQSGQKESLFPELL